MVFNFRLLKSRWGANGFRRLIRDWDRAVPPGGWPTQVLSNHDQSRHYTRYGKPRDPNTTARRARAAVLLLLTLRGTPFLYYGEEIGMHDVRLRYGQLHDPYTRRYWPFFTGRDPARTPMQWDETPQAGFTSGTPWLPVSPDYRSVNWTRESLDPHSLLSLYRRLIHLRKASPALTVGRYQEIEGGPLDCVIYLREGSTPDGMGECMLIAVNFSGKTQRFGLSTVKRTGVILLSTDPASSDSRFDPLGVRLGPEEGILVRLDQSWLNTPTVNC